MQIGKYIISFLVLVSSLFLLSGCSDQIQVSGPTFCPILETPVQTEANCRELMNDKCGGEFVVAPLFPPEFWWARCLED